MLISAARLRAIAEKALLAQEVTPSNARIQADLLIEAELRGLPSHGLQRLPRLIARLRVGLGLGIELLVAALAGSAFAPKVRGTLDTTDVANKGDLLVLIDPGAGKGQATGITAYLDRLRNSRPADPACPVAVPGDGMRARRTRALSEGIDLPETLYDELRTLARGRRRKQENK